MKINFSTRSTAIEIMDDLACDGEVVFQTLRELDAINFWLGGNAVTFQALRESWKSISKDHPITIADLGCGSGHMLQMISAIAEREGRKVKLFGFDANPHIIEYARNQSADFPNITFQSINVFSEEFRLQKFDLVLATLFMHHFSKEELVVLFSSLKRQAQTAIIINDIHRHAFAYYSIKWLTQLFSRSSMVKFDAPLSVLRAFRKAELLETLERAAIKNYQLRWKWAFRWQLIIPV
jgi:2-polyprenyl-3-methyl-5-hydroxy-6-metoxy-1,4-benzoquinol methylase